VTAPELASKVRGLASQHQFLKSPHSELITNLSYASGVAWMIYKRCHLKLPDANNLHEIANCWLNYYCSKDSQHINTNDSTIDKFVQNYSSQVPGEKPLCENKNLAA